MSKPWDCAGAAHTVKPNRPPGRSTRQLSRKNESGSAKCGTPRLLTTTSTVLGPKGRASASPDLNPMSRVMGPGPAQLLVGEVQAHRGGAAFRGGRGHHARAGRGVEHRVRRADSHGVEQRPDRLLRPLGRAGSRRPSRPPRPSSRRARSPGTCPPKSPVSRKAGTARGRQYRSSSQQVAPPTRIAPNSPTAVTWSAQRAANGLRRAVAQRRVGHRVQQCQPGRLHHVAVHADRGPGPGAVAGVHQHPGHRVGAVRVDAGRIRTL